jgi:glycosyltransferase involved in cell wall biosynthesis
LKLDCQKMKSYELHYLKQYSAVLVRTMVDQKILAGFLPQQRFEVIPPWVELGDTVPEEPSMNEQNLIFYGAMWRKVNSGGAVYFIEQVWPFIRGKKPEIKLYVVGSNPPKKLRKLANDHIIVTGFVDNVAEYYKKCPVAVVPLLAGSGIKVKVIQALSYGKPVVTTSVGAEGIPASESDGVFIKDEPEKMAQTILWLFENNNYRNYVNSARAFAAHYYDWAGGIGRLELLYYELVNSMKMQPTGSKSEIRAHNQSEEKLIT